MKINVRMDDKKITDDTKGQWVTTENGAHVFIDENGNAIGGNEKVVAAVNKKYGKGGSAKSSSESESNSSATQSKSNTLKSIESKINSAKQGDSDMVEKEISKIPDGTKFKIGEAESVIYTEKGTNQRMVKTTYPDGYVENDLLGDFCQNVYEGIAENGEKVTIGSSKSESNSEASKSGSNSSNEKVNGSAEAPVGSKEFAKKQNQMFSDKLEYLRDDKDTGYEMDKFCKEFEKQIPVGTCAVIETDDEPMICKKDDRSWDIFYKGNLDFERNISFMRGKKVYFIDREEFDKQKSEQFKKEKEGGYRKTPEGYAKDYKSEACKNSTIEDKEGTNQLSVAMIAHDQRLFENYVEGCEIGNVIQDVDTGSWAECIGGRMFRFYKTPNSEGDTVSYASLYHKFDLRSKHIEVYCPKTWFSKNQ